MKKINGYNLFISILVIVRAIVKIITTTNWVDCYYLGGTTPEYYHVDLNVSWIWVLITVLAIRMLVNEGIKIIKNKKA